MKGYELLKEARRLSGMKQKDMAKYFYMPYRTYQDWELGRSPSQDEMSAGFTPGVRFYFKYDDLEKHPLAVHDGFLPIKVKDEVKLADYVYMIVIPFEYKDQIMKVMPEKLSDRAFCLSPDELDVWQWSEKVYSFVRGEFGSSDV
mgnify:FL=1